jgi:hypothetical protein
MRPRSLAYTFAALDADGYINDATGAGPWTTIAANPDDGCSHPLTIASTADLRAITFTVTGTDAEGRTISEAITGPGAGATVTSTKYYRTLTSVSASATLGANKIDVGWTALARTPIFPLNHCYEVSALIVANMGGTLAYSVEWTADNVFSTASDSVVFHAVSGMAGLSADATGIAPEGATGMRVAVTSHTSGTLSLLISQPRG